jgi:hypothetical protein
MANPTNGTARVTVDQEAKKLFSGVVKPEGRIADEKVSGVASTGGCPNAELGFGETKNKRKSSVKRKYQSDDS